MKVLLAFLLWCLLLVVCWPLAILAIVVYPVIWLIALPFKLACTVTGAFLALVKALLYLPARILGYQPKA